MQQDRGCVRGEGVTDKEGEREKEVEIEKEFLKIDTSLSIMFPLPEILVNATVRQVRP